MSGGSGDGRERSGGMTGRGMTGRGGLVVFNS